MAFVFQFLSQNDQFILKQIPITAIDIIFHPLTLHTVVITSHRYSINFTNHLTFNDCLLLILVDVNECDINNGGCVYNCENTEGSYKCSCPANFFLNSDGHSCTGEFNTYYYYMIFLQFFNFK